VLFCNSIVGLYWKYYFVFLIYTFIVHCWCTANYCWTFVVQHKLLIFHKILLLFKLKFYFKCCSFLVHWFKWYVCSISSSFVSGVDWKWKDLCKSGLADAFFKPLGANIGLDHYMLLFWKGWRDMVMTYHLPLTGFFMPLPPHSVVTRPCIEREQMFFIGIFWDFQEKLLRAHWRLLSVVEYRPELQKIMEKKRHFK
jgi:hypothetical protein